MAEILPPNFEMEKDDGKLAADIIEDDEKEYLTKKELRGWYTYNFAVGFF
jgi:hypothetical protein